jgi:hypothetical protein
MHDNLVRFGQNLMEMDAPVSRFRGERNLAKGRPHRAPGHGAGRRAPDHDRGDDRR